MFFINHKRSGSCFEVFEHTLHTNELIYLETIQNELIITPNDVVPVSRHEFYFTNDHYSTQHLWKTVEGELFYFFFFFLFKRNITFLKKIILFL